MIASLVIFAVVRWVGVSIIPTVVVACISTFLRERVRPMATIRLVRNRWSTPVKATWIVLLLKDLSNLLHVGVLYKNRILPLLLINIGCKLGLQ